MVRHDSAAESHTGTTGSASEAAFSFTLTPVVARLRGVLVLTFSNANADDATAVAANGVPLTAVAGGRAVDTAGEPGDCKAWYVGRDLPPGALTITVTRVNNADVMYAVAFGVDADRDTEIKGTPVLVQGDGTLAEQGTDAGQVGHALRYAGVNSGLAAPPAAGSNSTIGPTIDFGARVISTCRETNGGAGSRSVGFSDAGSDDRAAVHLAIGEVVEVSGVLAPRPPFEMRTRQPYAPRESVSPAIGTRPAPPVGRPGPGAPALGTFNAQRWRSSAPPVSSSAEFAAAATVAVTATGVLTTSIDMAAVATVAVTAAAALTTDTQVAGAVSVTVTATGALTAEIQLVGAVSITVTTLADLTASAGQPTSGLAAAVGRRRPAPLGRGGPGAPGLAGFIPSSYRQLLSRAPELLLEASVTVAVSATADLTAFGPESAGISAARRSPPIGLPGPGRPGIVTLNPGSYWRLLGRELAAQATFDAAATISVTAAGALTTEVRLAAAPTVVITTTAGLTATIQMAAAANVTVSAVGDLVVINTFVAAVSATITASGVLTTVSQFAAAATVTLAAAGVLTAEVRFAATVAITVTAQADLQTIPPATVGRPPLGFSITTGHGALVSVSHGVQVMTGPLTAEPA